MERIDLHIHSNLSDGDDSIYELLSKIKDEKIDLFSITDHDNIKSIDILNMINDINYIPGVEMSSVLKKVKMHILGYGITSDGKIKGICDDIRIVRRELTLEIIDDLRKKGYCFPEEKIARFNKQDGFVLSKVDISKLLVEIGYATSVSEAFHEILKPYKIGPQIRQDALKIIEGINEDGGISILAHPGEITKKQNVDIKEVIDVVCEIGIDDLNEKINIMNNLNVDLTDINKISYYVSHGDFSYLQFIYEEEKVKAIIDFIRVKKLPIVWEIMRSYSYMDEYCKDAKINIDNLILYVKEFMKSVPLNKYDLKYMPYVYMCQLLRSTYGYKEVYKKDNNDILEFAHFRTELCKNIYENCEEISKRLEELI